MSRRLPAPLCHSSHRGEKPKHLYTGWVQFALWLVSLILLANSGDFALSTRAQTIPPAIDTVTPLALASATPTTTVTMQLPTPTDTATPVPPATATIPPEASATPTPVPNLLFSEFLADPKASSDEAGEWIELYNAGATMLNLRGWSVADLDNDRHTIAVDLVIAAGQYLVLARNGDSAVNGGVLTSYTYNNLTLANSSDELLLFSPDGIEFDRVTWGEGTADLSQSGASRQRTTLNRAGSWTGSEQSWPGSAGDKGSPGSGYLPPAGTPTPIASGTPMATTTPGARWPIAAAPGILQIEEVYYSGSDDEFVALLNTGATTLDLAGWVIRDEETPGQGEGMYALPAGYLLAPGTLFIVARDPTAFQNRWGSSAHAAFAGDNSALRLARRRALATGEWALNNNSDEVLLLNPTGEVADAVAFANGDYAAVQLIGTLKAPTSDSLQRLPGPQFPNIREVRHRFLFAAPDPFGSIALPIPHLSAPVPLNDNMVAIWGSLGAQSNFSADGSVPPHYLLDAAAAQGLHFLAIADPNVSWPWAQYSPTLLLPAWRWSNEQSAKAIVYSSTQASPIDQNGLLDFLRVNGRQGAWLSKDAPDASLVAFSADNVTAPGDLPALYKAWAAVGAPQLPAGNANPALPGAIDPAPRYTGLAVGTVDEAGLLAALSAHRGWLTNQPGLWLTLQAEVSGGTRQWMGTTLAPVNEVTIEIAYGDHSGDLAGLALWQNNVPIRQLDVAVGNHTWRVTVPALPDTFLFAVATQADGDFAVTSPIQVASATGGSVVINEVLPAAWDDHNGDGVISTADEFIELYNPSPYPLSLVGWQLVDAAGDGVDGRRFTFKAGQFVNGSGWLRLFNTESYISLNNQNEYVRLLNPAGAEIDRISWAINPGRGASLSRIPDGRNWVEGNGSPGNANRPFTNEHTYVGPTATPKVKHKIDEREDDYRTPTPVQLPPTYGQAGGPPGSIAQSKLAGLEASVEFRGRVTAPPGLFNASIYLADPVPDPSNGPLAGIGINVYLRNGVYPAQVGDWVRVRGQLRSFRGEMELWVGNVTDLWPLEHGLPLQPLPVTVADIGESLEGRLVTLAGTISSWQGDSIFLVDPATPDAPAVQITVRSSTGWRRPYVNKGQRWQATGIVSQFARERPWNGGYRILVRGESDLVKIQGPQ